MATNEFLPFATDPAANVISQATWAAGALSQGQSRVDGFLGGRIAESEEANKVWRQSSFVVAAIAQYISDTLGVDVLDNGDIAGFEALLRQTVTRTAGTVAPVGLSGRVATYGSAGGSVVTRPAE